MSPRVGAAGDDELVFVFNVISIAVNAEDTRYKFSISI